MTTKSKRNSMFNRLLLGMSIIDVVTSIANMFTTMPMPADTDAVLWSFGNLSTCTVQGFFVQIGIAAPLCKHQHKTLFLLFFCSDFTQALFLDNFGSSFFAHHWICDDGSKPPFFCVNHVCLSLYYLLLVEFGVTATFYQKTWNQLCTASHFWLDSVRLSLLSL